MKELINIFMEQDTAKRRQLFTTKFVQVLNQAEEVRIMKENDCCKQDCKLMIETSE